MQVLSQASIPKLVDTAMPLPEEKRRGTEPQVEPPPFEKIYLADNWYIRVDSHGYTLQPAPEGALGCIIKLYNDQVRRTRALKIPRLKADSMRENAYIAELLESEAEMIHSAPNSPYLMIADDVAPNPLRGLISLPQDAMKVSARLILVSFEKGCRPRFVSVELREGANGITVKSVTPSGETDRLKVALSQKGMLRQLEAAAQHPIKMRRRWNSSAFIQLDRGKPSTPKSPNCQNLKGDLAKNDNFECWYVSLPSINFMWACGTLQQSLDSGIVSSWTLEKVYSFLKNIASGIHSLHSYRMLHGDIRPANIMCVDPDEGMVKRENDPDRPFRKPENYKLGDYGCFSRERSSSMTGKVNVAGGSGHTVFGPAATNHRSTLFYSPERRTGVERENATIAIILSHPELSNSESKDSAPGSYLVCLAWGSDVLDQRTGLLREETHKNLLERWDKMREDAGQNQMKKPPTSVRDVLWKGDRIRVRDYIFTIELTESPKGQTDRIICYQCEPRYCKVFHEGISVLESGQRVPDQTLISLARYTELRQWTNATDIFGLGALAVYTVFTIGAKKRGIDRTEAEHQLQEMFEVLESVKYATAFWPSIEEACRSLERHAQTKVGNKKVKKELGELVQRCFTNIPGLPELYEFFQNEADFILFLHFVYCCIHRGADLKKPGEERGEYPFCENRLDNGDVAEKTVKRLEELHRYQVRGAFEQYKADHTTTQEFGVRDILKEGPLKKLEKEMQVLMEQLESARKEVGSKERQLKKANSELKSEQTKYNECEEQSRSLTQKLNAATAQQEVELKNVKRANEVQVQQNGALQGKLREMTTGVNHKMVTMATRVLAILGIFYFFWVNI